MILSCAVLATPLGDMLALDSGAGLCALEFTETGKRLVGLEARLRRWFPPHEIVDRDTPIIVTTRAWLDAYFAGTSADISGLPLDMRGADFEKRVWDALRRIPVGATASYAEIAKTIGAPKATRAVARACGSNRIAVAIPCHRVIGSDGSLTGYRGGIERKRALLAKEAKAKGD